jgi:D-alanine-D-alanine ligase
MGHSLRVAVVHNRDFGPDNPDGQDLTARADVENAARDLGGALEASGHQVTRLPLPPCDPAVAVGELLIELRRLAPDLVFNLCESIAGDARHEALLPSLFELAGIRYTGSGPVGLALALRKDVTKQLLRAHGVPTAEAVTLDANDVSAVTLPFPLIVKPAREDASIGISRHSVVHDRAQLRAQVAAVRASHQQPVIVERYIEGRELYVSLIGNPPTAFPMHEIDFSALPSDRPRIVTYDGKWNAESPEYHGTQSVRALGLDAATRARCEAAAQGAFAALELRDYARIDLRLAADGTPYVIDVNPNCDLSDGAGVSRAASYGGLTYPELIARICEAALARYRRESETNEHTRPRSREGSAPSVAAPSGVAELARADSTADPASDPAGRSVRARGAGRPGRTVQEGGGVGRARAHRRRAR